MSRLFTAIAGLVVVVAVSGMSGAVLFFADRAKLAEVRAHNAEAQQSVCGCKLLGGNDDVVMGFDAFVIGEARAVPGQMDSMLIPARTACGPLRLRAWLGVDAP